MDKSASEITFDENGVCNFCHQAEKELESIKHLRVSQIIPKIKEAGKGKKYDILIGLSGGLDSSYALYWAVELGLRPLCYSVDNGWNSPIADENIMRLVEGMKVPFFRYTIDKKKFAELQMAFIKAGLPNAEIPTDHILMATTYEMAAKYDIKYIISGGNVATESIMPASWGYNARDLVHIKDVYKKIAGKNLEGLPTCSLFQWNWYRWVKGIKIVYLLDYLPYNRNEAAAFLTKKFGYKEYGEKHCESVYTHWFQNFYLFEKFGFDKRKPHLSSMINSGQITREEALKELARERYYPPLGIERMALGFKRGSHDDYKKDHYVLISKLLKPFIWNS